MERLPAEIAHPVGEGIGQAMFVAEQLGADGAPIVEAARSAFLDGWSLAMFVAAVASVVGVIGIRQINRLGDDEPVARALALEFDELELVG